MLARRPPSIALQRVSTVDALVDALRGQILGGMLPPGSPLREGELCDLFGVSRHTVRTGLQALAHEGIVRHEPNRGAYVANLAGSDVLDLYRLRIVLETDAVRTLAAGDNAALEGVRVAHEQLLALPDDEAASWIAYRDADLAFHQALVDALDSPRTQRAYGALTTELALCYLQHQDRREHATDDWKLAIEEHRAILDALEQGDGDEACELLIDHLLRSRDRISAAVAAEQIIL